MFLPGRDQAATSLCSQELSEELPTLAPMLRALLKPGLAVMPLTLVELVKVFQFVQNIFDWNATTIMLHNVPMRKDNLVKKDQKCLKIENKREVEKSGQLEIR